MLKPLLVFSIVLLSQNSKGQTHDLAPLNTAFAGAVTFKIDKQDRLVMDFLDEGSRFRQDIVRLQELDPDAVAYSAEEDGIALKCLADHAQCLSKEIFKLDVVRVTSRVTIARPADDVDGQRSIVLLRELIVSARTKNDQADAETPHAPQRKNARKER